MSDGESCRLAPSRKRVRLFLGALHRRVARSIEQDHGIAILRSYRAQLGLEVQRVARLELHERVRDALLEIVVVAEPVGFEAVVARAVRDTVREARRRDLGAARAVAAGHRGCRELEPARRDRRGELVERRSARALRAAPGTTPAVRAAASRA